MVAASCPPQPSPARSRSRLRKRRRGSPDECRAPVRRRHRGEPARPRSAIPMTEAAPLAQRKAAPAQVQQAAAAAAAVASGGVAGPADRLHSAHLKAAELVTRRLLLADAAPRYHLLPALPKCSARVARFLGPDGFRSVHPALDPASRGVGREPTGALSGRGGGGGVGGGGGGGGYGVPERRADRKRSQISSVIRAAAALVENAAPNCDRGGVLVDFCGGCGHVGLVFAALYPHWEVVVVDLKPFAVSVVERRAEEAALGNVRTALRDIASFQEPFDIAIALHACGEASDVVLDLSIQARAGAVVAPCCLGGIMSEKLRSYNSAQPVSAGSPGLSTTTGQVDAPTSTSPDSVAKYQVTARQDWKRPRSQAMNEALGADEYNLLVRAADVSEEAAGDDWRRAAKTIVEGDRLAWVAQHGYHVRLAKMKPETCTPKNDILLVWPRDWGRPADVQPSTCTCLQNSEAAGTELAVEQRSCRLHGWNTQEQDFRVQRGTGDRCAALKGSSSTSGDQSYTLNGAINEWEWELDLVSNAAVDSVTNDGGLLAEFDKETIADISRQLFDGVSAASSSGEVRFPPSQGSRARKAVHRLASTLGMYHESFGRGQGRYVVVRRSANWPLFFDAGYVGYGGAWVAATAREHARRVPPAFISQRDIARSGRAHHITIVGAKEVRLLAPTLKCNMQELVKRIQELLGPLGQDPGSSCGPRAVGVGRVEDPVDDTNEVYFVIVNWPAAAAARAELGLPPHDFHITLGFGVKDVHGVRKDFRTLV